MLVDWQHNPKPVLDMASSRVFDRLAHNARYFEATDIVDYWGY